jgi:hypothetical protein
MLRSNHPAETTEQKPKLVISVVIIGLCSMRAGQVPAKCGRRLKEVLAEVVAVFLSCHSPDPIAQACKERSSELEIVVLLV